MKKRKKKKKTKQNKETKENPRNKERILPIKPIRSKANRRVRMAKTQLYGLLYYLSLPSHGRKIVIHPAPKECQKTKRMDTNTFGLRAKSHRKGFHHRHHDD